MAYYGPTERDSQMSKVYDWERVTPWYKKESNLTERDCKRIVKKLGQHTADYRKRLRISEPKLEILEGTGYSYSDGRIISLRRIWAMNIPVILHEYAHNCVGIRWGHGPKFMGCMGALLSHYMNKDYIEIANSLNEKRIKFESITMWKEKLGLNGRHKL